MSRILEALRKSDAGGAAAPAERPRYTAPAAAVDPRPAEPPRDTTAPEPATSVPVAAPWTAMPPLPSIPEGFRPELAGLRLHLETALAGRQPRVVLMASSAHGEGTTTVAAS